VIKKLVLNPNYAMELRNSLSRLGGQG